MDIIAKVYFYGADEGGRKGATPKGVFRCLFEFANEKFDCGISTAEMDSIQLGTTNTVSITFLSPELIMPRLRLGSRFTLWELKDIAEGVVVEIK